MNIYFLKTIIPQKLPLTSKEFTRSLQQYFPTVWDVKSMSNSLKELANFSLSNLANKLNQTRIENAHQAGSDSLLTLDLFFAIKKLKFPFRIPSNFKNNIFGLDKSCSSENTEPNSVLSSSTNNFYGFKQPQFPEQQVYNPYMYDFYNMNPELVCGFVYPSSYHPYNSFNCFISNVDLTNTNMGKLYQ